MYRLLCGYDRQKLNQATLAELVTNLDSPRLDVRLLSFHALREATGQSLFYRPEHDGEQRRKAVTRWQRQLATGMLTREATRR